MEIPAGTHEFGPDNATLTVNTTKAGAAAKAGHDLLIEVGSWQATLTATELSLTADSRSLRVLDGSGGIKALTDDDKADIKQTIDAEVLNGCDIAFRSNQLQASPDGLGVTGELQLAGRRGTISFTLAPGADATLTGTATVKQTDFGMKPYSALFGTLKVGDEVQVTVKATAPAGP